MTHDGVWYSFSMVLGVYQFITYFPSWIPDPFLPGCARKKVVHFSHKAEGGTANIKELGLNRIFLQSFPFAGNCICPYHYPINAGFRFGKGCKGSPESYPYVCWFLASIKYNQIYHNHFLKWQTNLACYHKLIPTFPFLSLLSLVGSKIITFFVGQCWEPAASFCAVVSGLLPALLAQGGVAPL